jgi:xylulokinase
MARLFLLPQQNYHYSPQKPLWSEQNPADWWNGAVNSIKQALEKANIKGEQVLEMVLTGQMHGLTLLEEKGEVFRPAYFVE